MRVRLQEGSFSNQVLVSIKNLKRDVDIRYGLAAPPYKQLFGFAKLWQLGENVFESILDLIIACSGGTMIRST